MARKGLPGKYIKQAAKSGTPKTMMKRAWALYRKSKRSSGSGTKKKTMSGTKKKATTKKRGTTMAKTTTKKRVSKTMGQPAKRQKYSLMRNRTINALVNGAVIGLSALAGLFLVNKIPWIQDQKSWVKASIQGGIGALAVVILKTPMYKKSASGLIAGAAITLAMPWMPEGLQFAPTTAGAAQLTAQELRDLQTLGIPANIMGKPTDYAAIATMGRSRGGVRSHLRRRF